jgi:hypothetical protein
VVTRGKQGDLEGVQFDPSGFTGVTMQTLYDVPIISRGRIIAPGEDAVEFGGRTGARFRAPNPLKHIRDLVLGDATRLRDLHDTPVREIVAFLAELGQRLALDRNPYMQEAFELGLKAGGLTEPVLRQVFDQMPLMFAAKHLTELAERTVGIEYLDGWVPQGVGARARVRVRAVGTRQLHITAGNVPVVAGMTIIRTALTKSDCLIKLPSNDPLTANAIARTMIEIDANHPVTKHVAVAYWKGGDEAIEREVCRISRIDKITAWGGMSSMKHIQKYLSPGMDLISLNPKLSISIVGREALEDAAAMKEAAGGIALLAGEFNQTACASTRVVYVESDTDDESLEAVEAFGKEICAALRALPPHLSTPAPQPNADLEAELRALHLEPELYTVMGDTIEGGVIVSRFADRVDFYGDLNNRIVNLVPLTDLMEVTRWCDDTTQRVGVYPPRLQQEMLDALSLAGVQRVVPLATVGPASEQAGVIPGTPHDGIEPMRRMVRWVINEEAQTGAAVQVAAE